MVVGALRPLLRPSRGPKFCSFELFRRPFLKKIRQSFESEPICNETQKLESLDSTQSLKPHGYPQLPFRRPQTPSKTLGRAGKSANTKPLRPLGSPIMGRSCVLRTGLAVPEFSKYRNCSYTIKLYLNRLRKPRSQRAQYGLFKEYSLNHIMDAYVI